MVHPWFRARRYGHLDVPVGLAFTEKVAAPGFSSAHSWSPLIRYMKRTKRYKPKTHKTEFKDRPIMYASHRDACILSKYAFDLTSILEQHYFSSGLTEHVIAYRALGKANYDFAAVAQKYAIENAPCVALSFDIRGFFDHLDHKLLKARLKKVLGINELSDDWYAVYREVTQHKWIERDHLAADPLFGPRLKAPGGSPVATMSEINTANISVFKNPNHFGIPQGTPISSVFANLYMMDFDKDISEVCGELGALYQRYSDDILIICQEKDKAYIVAAIEKSLLKQKLELSADKTEEALVKAGGEDPFQYLGFYISYDKVYLRSPSIGRQWRKLRRSIRRASKVGNAAIKGGKAQKVYTKKLRAKFSPVGTQNFSSYARKAANLLESKQILKQVRRFERVADKAIRGLNK